ncbi:MAG: DUF2569 family protein, partial [bacterium]|nr:DUF2569 family protein [bacterium]
MEKYMEESGTPIENSQVEGGQGENTSTGGIGGGLIVALICVIVVHLYSLISLSTFISRFSYFPLFNTFMIIHVLILMALSALAIFLFFTKKKETVETIVKLYTLFVVVESINLVKLIFYFGRTTTWLMTALSASLGLAIAWIIYFRKSPRPQATFTNETTEPFLKDVVEILSKIKIGKILGVPEMTGSSTTVVDAAAQPAIQPLSTEEAPTPKPAAPPVPRPPKELKGLGGWLIVPAILIFLYPLLHLFNMVLISMRMRNTGLVQGLITLAIFGLIIGLAVITAIKFFTKKEDAPKFVVLNLFAFPVLLLIDNIRTAIWGYIDISFFAIAINLAAAPIFFKFYFKKSKRAEKTFVNPAGGMSKVLRGGFIAIIVLYAVSTVTLNILDEKARNNLAAAIKTDNTELLSLPLFLGLEKERRGILTEALTKNSWKVAKKLVEAGVDPNSGSRGSSALNFAIGAKDKDFIKLLIDKGARVDETVLISAIRTGDPELLNDLVKQGNITDKRILNNLLVFSVNSGQIGTAKYLMSKGAEPKKSTKTYGFDYEGKIQELLGSEESAGDTELLNNLLTTAVGKNHIEVAEFLIEKGADYKIKIGVREE